MPKGTKVLLVQNGFAGKIGAVGGTAKRALLARQGHRTKTRQG